jgi:hypothetical protein
MTPTHRFNLETQHDVTFFSCLSMPTDWPVLHAFSTRLGGVSTAPYTSLNLGFGSGDDRACVVQNRQRFGLAVGFNPEQLATLRQVHGRRVLVLSMANNPAAVQGMEADALITNCPETPLAILTADCYPVVLVAPSVPLIGIAHAGRRGTVVGVVPATVQQMCDAFGLPPEAVFAAIGPGIGACCYEVDDASAAPFMPQFPIDDPIFRTSRPHHLYLDLERAIFLQLRAIGVPPSQIWSAHLCTACHSAWFYSYRRDGPRSGRMLNIVMIRPHTVSNPSTLSHQ